MNFADKHSTLHKVSAYCHALRTQSHCGKLYGLIDTDKSNEWLRNEWLLSLFYRITQACQNLQSTLQHHPVISDRMLFYLLRIKRQLIIRQLTPEQCKDKEDGTTLLYELYMTWIVKSFQNSVTRSGRQSWFLLYLFLFVEQASFLVDIYSFHFDCCFFRLVTGSAAQVYLVEFLSSCILNHDDRAEYFVNCILSSRKALLMPSSSSVSTRKKSCK